MQSVDTIKLACVKALDTMGTDPQWQASYCAVVDPRSVLELANKLESSANGADADQLQLFANLIRDLTGYVRMVSGDKSDPVRDDLLLQARQTIEKFGL